MKHSTLALALVALLVLGLTTACGSSSTKRTITVSASATIKAKPNLISFSLGVSSKDASASAALNKNSAAMRRVIAAIKKQGVAARDIQTQNIDVSPTYSHGQVSGYSASNSMSVDLHQISKAGALITHATAAGANLEGGLSFSLGNTDLTYRQALVKALDKAKAKAASMAEHGGLSLGKPVRIKEGTESLEPVYSGAYRTAALSVATKAPVESGRVSTSASVTVVYSAS